MRVRGKDFKVGFKRTYRQRDDEIPNPGWSPGISEASNLEIPYDTQGLVAYTAVEIVFPMYVEPDLDDELRGWIQAVINRLLEVYRFATEEFHVKGLSLRELWEYEVQTMDHTDEGIDPSEIVARRVAPLGGGVRLARTAPMPDSAKGYLSEERDLPLPQTLYLNARREMLQENYRIAVLEAETAFEVLVSQSIARYYRNKGLPDAEVENKLKPGLKNLIKDHLAKCCGSKFEGTPQHAAWESDLYEVRNAVVHRGAAADATKAQEALDAAQDAMRWVEVMVLRVAVTDYYKAYYAELRREASKAGLKPTDLPHFLRRHKRWIEVVECQDGYVISHHADPDNVESTSTPEAFVLVTGRRHMTVSEFAQIDYAPGAAFFLYFAPVVQNEKTGEFVEPDGWERKDAVSNVRILQRTMEDAREEARKLLSAAAS